jgi:hypothetical protein
VLEDADVKDDTLIPKNLALELLLDDSPLAAFSEYYAEQNNLPVDLVEESLRNEYGTGQEVKGMILQGFLPTIFSPENIPSLVADLKSGRVRIYPETAMFKLVRYFPSSLLKKVLGAVIDRAKEATR